MTRASRITFIAVAIGIITLASLLIWSFYFNIEAERTTFSPIEWKEKVDVYTHSNDPGCVRGGMALDIIATDTVHRMPINDVASLLGEPDGKKESNIFYELGQCSGFGWQSTILQVNFNNEGLATNAVILRQQP